MRHRGRTFNRTTLPRTVWNSPGGFASRPARPSWYQIRNAVNDVTEVYIYDEIGYWGITAAQFIEEMRNVSSRAVDLHINSPGGEIYDGIAIFNCLRTHPATVNVTVDALAASAASFIAMAGDEVTMAPYSQMMIHDGFGLCIGDAQDMRAMAERLDAESNNIASIYAGRAGGSIEEWRERMLAETWYSATEAVTAGLADRVDEIASRDAPAAPTNRWDLSIFRYRNRDSAPAPLGLPAVRDTSVDSPPRGQGVTGPTVRPEPAQGVHNPPVTPGSVPLADWDGGFMRAMFAEMAGNMPEPTKSTTKPEPAPVRIDAEQFRTGLLAISRGQSAT